MQLKPGENIVILKTRQPAGRGPHSWCSHESSQVPEEIENKQKLELAPQMVVFHVGVATVGLSGGKERKVRQGSINRHDVL